MPKHIYCAKCGMELKTIKKAIPHEGKVIVIVEPHKCNEVSVEEFKGFKTAPPDKVEPVKDVRGLDEIFDSFPFVQKLNKEISEHETISDVKETGDKRDKKHLREELVTSTAPLGVLNVIKGR